MLYTILIYGESGLYDRLPASEQDAHMKAHKDLQDKLMADGTYRGAVRLMGPSTAMKLEAQGDNIAVLDGPFAETKEHLLGFYLVECESMEGAVAAARALPQSISHYEVRPVGWAGGF
ncbi:MAG: YciI family protein [Hyphomicrobiales bacterium]|nr:YciI family protein [Hyphomicrobiales bacterium]